MTEKVKAVLEAVLNNIEGPAFLRTNDYQEDMIIRGEFSEELRTACHIRKSIEPTHLKSLLQGQGQATYIAIWAEGKQHGDAVFNLTGYKSYHVAYYSNIDKSLLWFKLYGL